MLIAKAFEGIKKAIDEKAKTIEFLASDDSIDHDGEIIALEAWDKRIHEFRKNPIFCWGHPLGDRHAGPERLLGKIVSDNRDSQGLWLTAKYAVDANPLARMCWELSVADILRAGSVGADALEVVGWWDNQDKIAGLKPAYRSALEQGSAGAVIMEAELWEFSQVLKGSNRNALKAAMAKGLVKSTDLSPLFGKSYPILTPVSVDLKAKTAENSDISAAENGSKPPVAEPETPADNAQSVDQADQAPAPEVDPDEEALLAALREDPDLLDDLIDVISDLVEV